MPDSRPDTTVAIVDLNGDPDMTVAVIGDQVVSLVGSSPGDVLTVQAGGDTVAPEPPAADPAAVPKALYDANTILKADTDDTPEALSVPASTVVGRKSSGEISALTVAELRTLLGLESTLITASNAAWPIPAGATILEIVAVSGGGGGGGAGSAAAAQLQASGGGGADGGQVVRRMVVGANTVLNIVIGAGGSGGAGGAAGGNAGANGGVGGDTAINATGVTITAHGGAQGRGSTASSTTGGLGGSGGTAGTNTIGGTTAPDGAGGEGVSGGNVKNAGRARGYSYSGGGGGGSATATNGGGGGVAGTSNGIVANGVNGGSGTSAGVNGASGVANTGAGGGGGGSGAAGTGAGGNGGVGGSGYVIVRVLA